MYKNRHICSFLKHTGAYYNISEEEDIETSADVEETRFLTSIYRRTRVDSCNEPSSATPGSVTSVTSNESSKCLMINEGYLLYNVFVYL